MCAVDLLALTTTQGRFYDDGMFIETHLKAERGGLGLPFKSGTGWPGLKELVEKGAALERGIIPRVQG